jgi:nitrite reductase/ring-hydroxylating ferredoxin subunit
MNGKLVIIVLLIIAASLVAEGCTGTKSSISSKNSDDLVNSGELVNNGEPIKGTWINTQVNADQVSIPVQSIDDYTNVHFKVNTDNGELPVMAYRFNDKIYVRSNECVPCSSQGFSLKDGTLVCDTCGTVFDAVTGKGIEGGCVAYHKESIPYTISDGKITMKINDVVTAHKKTIVPNKGS